MNNYIKTSKFKVFEYQFEFGSHDLLGNSLYEFTLKNYENQDHPGIEFIFAIRGLFFICLSYRDIRHWDYDKDILVENECDGTGGYKPPDESDDP